MKTSASPTDMGAPGRSQVSLPSELSVSSPYSAGDGDAAAAWDRRDGAIGIDHPGDGGAGAGIVHAQPGIAGDDVAGDASRGELIFGERGGDRGFLQQRQRVAEQRRGDSIEHVIDHAEEADRIQDAGEGRGCRRPHWSSARSAPDRAAARRPAPTARGALDTAVRTRTGYRRRRPRRHRPAPRPGRRHHRYRGDQ